MAKPEWRKKISDERLERMRHVIYRELTDSEAQRDSHIQNVQEYARQLNLTDYDFSELLRPDADSIRTPTALGRVKQVVGSMFSALDVKPFVAFEVPDGEDATLARHGETAVGEELARAELPRYLLAALGGTFGLTLGLLKLGVKKNEHDLPAFDIDAPKIQNMYWSPWQVRDLAECVMVAEQFTAAAWWVKDMALAGVYDPEAVKALHAPSPPPPTDGGQAARELHGTQTHVSRPDSEGRDVTLYEVYLKDRPDEDSPTEDWKVVYSKQGGGTILRAERWLDGLPYFPVRHEAEPDSLFSPAFPAITRDLSYTVDQLVSGMLYMNRMATSPYWIVDPISDAWRWFEAREAEDGNAYISPGEVLPGRKDDVTPHYWQPAPPNIQQAVTMLTNMANEATIPPMPLMNSRSATEVRFVVAQVSQAENRYLKLLKPDFSRFGEYAKRLFWRYFTKPVMDGEDITARVVKVGRTSMDVSEDDWATMSVTTRGTTTLADRALQTQSAQMLMGPILQTMAQKPMWDQLGLWPQVWNMLRRVLDVNDIDDYEPFIGKDPTPDPREKREQDSQVSPAVQLQISQMLTQQGGGAGLGALMGGGLRGDGTDTTAAGGSPIVNQQGPFN